MAKFFQQRISPQFAKFGRIYLPIYPTIVLLKCIGGVSRSIHNIGFYPCRFIDQIPRWGILRYSQPGEHVLDPFSGVGTTVAEALLARRHVTAVDYHPLAALITSVKSNPPSEEEYRKALHLVCDSMLRIDDLTNEYSFASREFWFQSKVIKGLCAIRFAIDQLNKSSSRALMQVAFAMTARKLSNMDRGMILAAKRSSRNENKLRTTEEVFNTFMGYALDYGQRVSEYLGALRSAWKSQVVQGEVFEGDSRNLGRLHADLIVSSPPYINSMDYVWATKLELHWLGLVTSSQDRLDLYGREIGTERIGANVYKELGKMGIPEIDDCIADIYFAKNYKASGHQNQLRARCTYQYFCDMYDHLSAAYKVLREGGHYVLIVGENQICKVHIPTANFLSMLAKRVGFNIVHEFAVVLRNRTLNVPRNVGWAGTIDHDRVISLRK